MRWKYEKLDSLMQVFFSLQIVKAQGDFRNKHTLEEKSFIFNVTATIELPSFGREETVAITSHLLQSSHTCMTANVILVP